MNIGGANDYSFLFNSLNKNSSKNTGANNMLMIDFTELDHIQSGAYLKSARSVYDNKPVVPSKEDKDISENKLIQSETAANDLVEQANALLNDKSLFEKKDITTTNEDGTTVTTTDYDMEAITKGVDAFVSAYNKLVGSFGDSDSVKVLTKAMSLVDTTENFETPLKEIGITINKDNTLSIDKDVFKKADVSTIKNLFQGTGSYGATVEKKAELVAFTAKMELSNHPNTYNSTGNGDFNFSTGDFIDGFI